MRERMAVPEAAADLLSRPPLQGLLAALIDEACAMADLVPRCGMSYSLLSHHLRRMVGLGLVQVVGHRPRAGRASKLYRASARTYFIPAAWCKVLPGDQLARELRTALQRAHSPKGLLLTSEGGPRMQLLLHEPRADTTELWMRLHLTPAAAREFNAEVRALFERWRGRANPKGAGYLVHAACTRAD